jgi:hypothetical protein
MNWKGCLESILDTTTVSAGCLKADGMNLCPFVLVITSAGQSWQAPYQHIEQDLCTYIDPEHLPGELQIHSWCSTVPLCSFSPTSLSGNGFTWSARGFSD